MPGTRAAKGPKPDQSDEAEPTGPRTDGSESAKTAAKNGEIGKKRGNRVGPHLSTGSVRGTLPFEVQVPLSFEVQVPFSFFLCVYACHFHFDPQTDP